MSESSQGKVTMLLRAWHAGDSDAYRQLSAILYGELRRRAVQCMRGQRPGGTLQATALVHEVFMRLAGAHEVDWQDRKHFLAVAARAMRRLLIDLARAKDAVRHGARAAHVPLDSGMAAPGRAPLDLLALDLRFFAGLTVEETAEVLDVSPDTVARDWRMARTWLLRELDRR